MSLEEDLKILEVKLKQLKLDYEQYFSGIRPREPSQARSEIRKQILEYSNTPIKNTALRFKFNTIHSRYQAFKRQWDNITRQIENGTYERHVFKANMKDRRRAEPVAPRARGAAAAGGSDLFAAYKEAAASCGQNVAGLTPAKLDAVIRKQEAEIKKKLGVERVQFKVVVQDGKVKLKASKG